MAINNNINKDSLLVLLSARKKPASHKAYHIPRSQESIPTSRISLASTLYTQGLFIPLQVTSEEYLCVEDSSGGHRQILVLYR